MDGPKRNGAVRIADSNSIAVDPRYCSRFDAVLVDQAESCKWFL